MDIKFASTKSTFVSVVLNTTVVCEWYLTCISFDRHLVVLISNVHLHRIGGM